MDPILAFAASGQAELTSLALIVAADMAFTQPQSVFAATYAVRTEFAFQDIDKAAQDFGSEYADRQTLSKGVDLVEHIREQHVKLILGYHANVRQGQYVLMRQQQRRLVGQWFMVKDINSGMTAAL